MNFFEGEIAGRDGGVVFQARAGFSLPVPAALKDKLAARRDSPMTVGLRPEDIGSTAAEQLPDPPRIQAKIDVIEPMGSEAYVYLSAGDSTFVSRVDSHREFRVGQDAAPAVYIDKAHFFDPATQERL
jgi:multiple sugar transport system ATP-binding protein